MLFNKPAPGLNLLHASLAFNTSAGCAFTCLLAFTSQVCPWKLLSCCLMVCFISSTHYMHSNYRLYSHLQTTTPSPGLLCVAVLCLCLFLLEEHKDSSKKPSRRTQPSLEDLCLSCDLSSAALHCRLSLWTVVL